jgi:sensor histidine kinase YesM
MSASGASITAAAHAAPGFWSRTLRGFTWNRLAIFCGVVSVACIGHAVTNLLMPDRTLLTAAKAFVWQFFYLSLLFGSVWIAVVMVGNWAPERTGPRVLALVAAVAAGLVLSNLVTHDLLILMYKPDKDEQTFLKQISASVLWSHVIAAGVLAYFFLTREEEVAARLHQAEMQRVDLDCELAEARLQVMQAQVEPHFLFNTLANVRRLFQTDPDGARAMLTHLSRYLSAMLPRMRSAESTLGHELALALAYLHVQEIRMGSRLTVRTDVPEALEALPFPPMMLVTLVENAIRHGLNPLPEGGEVRIAARIADGKVRLSVADSGRGLSESSGSGVGLANIRARLNTLYAGQARLLLAQNPSGGVTATIEVPSADRAQTAKAA